MDQEQKREARAKAIRQMILSCAVKLKDSSENTSYHRLPQTEVLSAFLKKTDDDSEDSKPPSEKRAKRTSSLTGENFQLLAKSSQRKFRLKSSVSNFSGKGKGAAKTISSPIEAWSLLFSDDLLNIILKYTNREIEHYRRRSTAKNLSSHYNMLDMRELKAFLGLLYYAGWAKKNNAYIGQYFSVHNLHLFRTITSMMRLEFLFPKLTFHDKTTCDEFPKGIYNFTFIREIWDLFIANCVQHYEPGYNVTIDEQIFSFHESCNTDLIPISRKRGKCGLKYVTMNDSETLYMINAIPCISNIETESLEKFFSHVIETSAPIHNTNRNITCGSWYTSIPLVDTMREKFSLTMIGSLQQNNPDVSPLFENEIAKETYEFAYQINNNILVSYKPENDEMILLLSSLHSDEISKVENKSEIVLHYNKTMGASDTFDQLCHQYTVNRETERWPLRIFYGMLDQAAVNSFVLYTLNANNRIITRDTFLLELSMALIKPYIIKLLSRPSVHILNQCRLKSFLDLPEEDVRKLRLDISNKSKTAKCFLCPTSKRIKTYSKCLKCNNFMCTKHKASICQNCAEDEVF